MPWEKTFEESEVIGQVMQVFWEKGYSATSISDITEATGIKRGSLYNAFDGKRELFFRALLKYDNEERKRLLRELESVDDPRDAIETFFNGLVKASLNDPDKKGCLLVNTSLDYSIHDEEVQKVVSDSFKEIANFFEKSLKRGQELGRIPCSIEPRSTAKALVALIVGIRVMGRGIYGKAALEQIANQAKRLIS